MLKWAVGEQLPPYQTLAVVLGLRRGRTEARETAAPILPVEIRSSMQRAHMPAVVANMLGLQRLAGMRPAEVCIVLPCHLDRSGG